MIDHTSIEVSDLKRSKAFYKAALSQLGYKILSEFMTPEGKQIIGFGQPDKPDFWISEGPTRHEIHLAFRAPDREAVTRFYHFALKLGGKDDGAPGLRPEYHENYFGAFVLDPDGNSIEAVCHDAKKSDSDAKPSDLMTDFPKVQCPYVRKLFEVDGADFKKAGSRYKLKSPRAYLVTDQINPGFEWVFEDADVIAVEKLDGTNIKIRTQGGRLEAIQNRLNVIDPLQVMKGKTFLLEGIFQSIDKEYVKPDGEQVGELIGPKLQGNPYELDRHEWYPFEKSEKDLTYRSFLEHPRTFENLSAWFKDHLHSRYFTKRASKLGLDKKVFAEGVIFYSPNRRAQKKTYMAKLRRDMFDWFYVPEIKVLGYDPTGANGLLPQDIDNWD
jgi:catechol 2,3-dioxygenase-like lactoylglutathione lyase family enzyme